MRWLYHALVGIDLPELIRLKLSSCSLCRRFILPSSGLICLNWYDWNDLINSLKFMVILLVGIDLPELIRLKLLTGKMVKDCGKSSRDWSAWIDTIETSLLSFIFTKYLPVGIDLPELIRLKRNPLRIGKHHVNSRDWSVWIDTIETFLLFLFNFFYFNLVGIDLPELIRLKPSKHLSSEVEE